MLNQKNQEEPAIISIDKEILDIMGPPAEDAAPRMSSETEKPTIVNKEINSVSDGKKDFQSKKGLKTLFLKPRNTPKYLTIIVLIIILLCALAVIPISRYIISQY